MKATIQALGVKHIPLLRSSNAPLKGVLENNEKITLLNKACYTLVFGPFDLLNKKSIYIYHYHTVRLAAFRGNQ